MSEPPTPLPRRSARLNQTTGGSEAAPPVAVAITPITWRPTRREVVEIISKPKNRAIILCLTSELGRAQSGQKLLVMRRIARKLALDLYQRDETTALRKVEHCVHYTFVLYKKFAQRLEVFKNEIGPNGPTSTASPAAQTEWSNACLEHDWFSQLYFATHSPVVSAAADNAELHDSDSDDSETISNESGFEQSGEPLQPGGIPMSAEAALDAFSAQYNTQKETHYNTAITNFLQFCDQVPFMMAQEMHSRDAEIRRLYGKPAMNGYWDSIIPETPLIYNNEREGLYNKAISNLVAFRARTHTMMDEELYQRENEIRLLYDRPIIEYENPFPVLQQNHPASLAQDHNMPPLPNGVSLFIQQYPEFNGGDV